MQNINPREILLIIVNCCYIKFVSNSNRNVVTDNTLIILRNTYDLILESFGTLFEKLFEMLLKYNIF